MGISWRQWLCVLLGAGLSGFVLFTPIWPAVRHQASKSAVVIMAIIVTLHLLLAVGFMLYFFHVPSGAGGHDHGNNTLIVQPSAGSAENETGHLSDAQAAQAAEMKASVESSPETKLVKTDKDNPGDSGNAPKQNNKADVKSDTDTGSNVNMDNNEESKPSSSVENKSEAQPGNITEGKK